MSIYQSKLVTKVHFLERNRQFIISKDDSKDWLVNKDVFQRCLFLLLILKSDMKSNELQPFSVGFSYNSKRNSTVNKK